MDIWETWDPWRFNILFCCMPLFLPSTTPIWTIDSRTSLAYLSDACTPLLRISSFPVGSTNSKNYGDTDVYVAYPLPCRYLQHRSLQIILYCIIVFGWSEPIITEIEWNRYLSGIQLPSLFFPSPRRRLEESIAEVNWDMSKRSPFRLSFPYSSHWNFNLLFDQ